MSAKKMTPMSERLFNTPGNGGPMPRHLQTMLRILCKRDNKDMPNYGTKEGYAIAKYLQNTYSNADINWAHDQAREYYARLKDNQGTNQAAEMGYPTYNELNKTLYGDSKPTDANNKPSDSTDNDSDNKYVFRSDYDKDLKYTAEALTNIHENIDKTKDYAAKLHSDLHSDVISLRSIVKSIQDQTKTVIEIKDYKTQETQFEGVVHKQFPLLAKAAGARLPDNTRLNVWLYGPAGTGKTHAAKTLAQSFFGGKYRETNSDTMAEFTKEFNRDWSDYNYSPTLSTAFQVMGYMDANGRYVPTPFYLTWKYGGVFLLDEIDGSMQDALLGLNGALSSTYASFPCGVVPRHKDCIVIAGANTTGHGGDIEYLGTMKQNVAFLDRWTFIEWPHDDALENSLVQNSHWVQRVRNVRANLTQKKIKGHVITMRASIQGAALLECGIPFEQVEQMVLRKGIPSGTWDLIK